MCPNRLRIVAATLEPGRKEGRWLARFEEDVCAACPFFQKECRVESRKRSGPTLLVKTRAIRVAVLRQRITSENNGIRAGVEATIRSVKHVFAGGKLPVRGLIRSQMVVLGSALLVNVHRLAQYYFGQASQLDENGSEIVVLSLFLLLIAHLTAVSHRWDVVFERRLVLQAHAA